jgi:pimeloyl-ACP methyl ester carboxylesterase
MTRLALIALHLVVITFVACNSEHLESDSDGEAESGIQRGYVPVNKGRIFYEESGVGDPVVLIHGVSGDRRHWDNQFEFLASGFRVVRYDVRGFGNSSLPVSDVPYADQADLLALLDYLQITDAHIVGWSMGSGIAFDFAATHPERTRTVTSIGPWVNGYSTPLITEFYERMGAVGDAAAEGGAKAATSAFMDLIFGETVRSESAGIFFEEIALEYSWWAFLNESPRESLEPTTASSLNRLSMPTLVVTAEFDLDACREMGRFIVASVPDSRQTIMPDTGHLMHIEKPDEFNALLSDFLNSETQR